QIERRGEQGLNALTAALKSNRLGTRGRLHAVWIIAHLSGPGAVERLLHMAKTDAEPRVQAQAVRAVADLVDPVLIQHRLAAGPGDAELASRLAELARGRDPQVQLEIVVALGRLHWAGFPAWLGQVRIEPDTALAHALQ